MTLTDPTRSEVSGGVREGSGMPVEWECMAVDTKYTQPYVGLGLLKQEQEVLSQELRGVPDRSKVGQVTDVLSIHFPVL